MCKTEPVSDVNKRSQSYATDKQLIRTNRDKQIVLHE